MGNSDGIIEALTSYRTNKVEDFNNGYFSFAKGNEVALVLNNINGYFILNCDEELWEEVKNEIIKTKKDKKLLIEFWKNKSKDYEISTWSTDFENLN